MTTDIKTTTEPPAEYRILYENTIKEAKKVFGKHFTCKLDIAPHFEIFEVARIPLIDQGGKFDSVQVCLEVAPAVFLTAYMLKGEKKVMEIGTRSGGIKELWDIVYPIIKMEACGEIGIKFFGKNPDYKGAVLREAEKDRDLVLETKRNLLIKHRLKDLTDEEAEKIATVMELDIVFEERDRCGEGFSA